MWLGLFSHGMYIVGAFGRAELFAMYKNQHQPVTCANMGHHGGHICCQSWLHLNKTLVVTRHNSATTQRVFAKLTLLKEAKKITIPNTNVWHKILMHLVMPMSAWVTTPCYSLGIVYIHHHSSSPNVVEHVLDGDGRNSGNGVSVATDIMRCLPGSNRPCLIGHSPTSPFQWVGALDSVCTHILVPCRSCSATLRCPLTFCVTTS